MKFEHEFEINLLALNLLCLAPPLSYLLQPVDELGWRSSATLGGIFLPAGGRLRSLASVRVVILFKKSSSRWYVEVFDLMIE